MRIGGLSQPAVGVREVGSALFRYVTSSNFSQAAIYRLGNMTDLRTNEEIPTTCSATFNLELDADSLLREAS